MVLKTRDFIDSLVNSSSATTVPGHKAVVEKAQDILRQVNSRATHLAATIKKSLLNLPNSQLWGMTEQYKRLKLLISLSEYSLAAEGFASIKSSNMNLAVQSVETSTDILYYSRELSKSFFHELYQCIALYHSLFYSGAVLGNTANAASASGGSHSPKPISSKRGRANSMISISNTLQAGNALINSNVSHNNEIQMLLVQWTQSQVSLYVQALYKQALLVVNESAGLWIIHLRDLSQYFVLHHGIQSNTALFGIAAGGNSLPTSPASLSVNTAMDPSFELDRDNSSSRDFGDVMPRPSLSPQRANSVSYHNIMQALQSLS